MLLFGEIFPSGRDEWQNDVPLLALNTKYQQIQASHNSELCFPKKILPKKFLFLLIAQRLSKTPQL